MSAYKQIGRQTIRGMDAEEIGCSSPEAEVSGITVTNRAESILKGIRSANGASYSDICGYELGEMNTELKDLAEQDSRISYKKNKDLVVIKMRGETLLPPSSEGMEIITMLENKFGIPVEEGVRIYDVFRQDSDGICRNLVINGYGPMLASRADVLADSLMEGQGKSEDPRISAIKWTTEKYEAMTSIMLLRKGTEQSENVGLKFGMAPKYTIAIADIIGQEDMEEVCSRLSDDGYTRLIRSNPEILIASHFEAKRLMPDHDDPVEATLLVAAMNYEKLAAKKREPFIVPLESETSWEELGLDIGREIDVDNGISPEFHTFVLKADTTESLMEHNDEGEWGGLYPVEDEPADKRREEFFAHPIARPDEETTHLDDVVNF